MAPDTTSSLYPDRPIRPLPKRRIRDQLSPEVADGIEYPPAPEVTSPLFYYPCSPNDRETEYPGVVNRERAGYEVDRQTDNKREDVGIRRVSYDQTSTSRPGRSSNKKPNSPRRSVPQLPASTSSSADGYDSFENTNNKKKRKIPAAGDLSLNGGHSLNDISSGQVTAGDQQASTSAGYSNGYGSSSSAGIAGPGRGRYGRSRNGRSPLRTLSDASNNWAGRNGKLRSPQWTGSTSQQQPAKTGGIISSAIANAQTEKAPSSTGQENVSLLQQQQPSKSTPASTQFTFTCDSQVPSNLAWPGSDPRYHQNPPATAQWQQTRGHPDQHNNPHPSMAGQSQSGAAPTGHDGQRSAPAPEQPPRKKESARRKLNRELHEQARARKREQHIWNLENQPKDVYICGFCEFESVNGYKPKFLIRAFEMKERKKRLEAQRRQQLLEKAKARGRKGKKGKAPAKNNGPVDNTAQAGQNVPPPDANLSEGTRSEEYDDEGEAYYEEDGASYDDGPYDDVAYDDVSYDEGDEDDVPDLVQVNEVKGGTVPEIQQQQRRGSRGAAVDGRTDTGQRAAA